MHPRDRLKKIIDETSQLIIDIQWWNNNRLDVAPFDCEVEQVLLGIARKAASQWDAGDTVAAQFTMQELSDYAAAAAGEE